MILVTGGAGFIGANFIHGWLQATDEPVINVDKLTYAGNLQNLAGLADDQRYIFVRGDIGDVELIAGILRNKKPRALINLAAESHVDRSIHHPDDFIQTNVVGTFRLLQCALAYWSEQPEAKKASFRFLHVSTDEVYGSLGPQDPPFTERTAYAPNSPYAASKAASDHLARAYYHTYGLPVVTTNCSNNYGPYQFPEKLIPLAIHNALSGKSIPIYGDGRNIRDWLYVTDHCAALERVLEAGEPGESYNIGVSNEVTNIELLDRLCAILDEMRPRADGGSYTEFISFIKDRPGHDRRYAIDPVKMIGELGWRPLVEFEDGLRKTAQWYLDNPDWVNNVLSGSYRDWIRRQYGEELV